MSGLFKGRELVVMGLVRVGFRPQINEEAIVAVDCRCAERLAVDGNQALAVLSGGLSDQLLRLRTEIGDRLG